MFLEAALWTVYVLSQRSDTFKPDTFKPLCTQWTDWHRQQDKMDTLVRCKRYRHCVEREEEERCFFKKPKRTQDSTVDIPNKQKMKLMQRIERRRQLVEREEAVHRFFKKPKQTQDLTMHSSFIQKTLREGRRQMALPTNPALLPDPVAPPAASATQVKYFSEMCVESCYDETSPINKFLKKAYRNEGDPLMFEYALDTLFLQNKDGDTLHHKALQKFDSAAVLAIDSETVHIVRGIKSHVCTVRVPPGVKNIDNEAFAGCNRLREVVLPESIKTIENYAFRFCVSLKVVSISPGVRKIGSSAFDGNLSLQSIDLPASVTSLGNSVFRLCIRLTRVSLPDSLTHIPDQAFQYCVNLTHVGLPTSVVNIGSLSFAHCVSLRNLWLPDNVKTIADHAFQACYTFTKLELPSRNRHKVEIGKNVFFECHSLEAFVYRPVSSRVFVVWALGHSRNRNNWHLTSYDQEYEKPTETNYRLHSRTRRTRRFQI